MPVIFSHEIDVDSLQAGDFQVRLASGKVGALTCVTLAPADDEGELRTVLLAGQCGSVDDPPLVVDVVGNLLSRDGSLNFKGLSSAVTPLEQGPTIVLAELVAPTASNSARRRRSFPSAAAAAARAARGKWAGGVTKPGGVDADDDERRRYEVTVEDKDGSAALVRPFALVLPTPSSHRVALGLFADGCVKSSVHTRGMALRFSLPSTKIHGAKPYANLGSTALVPRPGRSDHISLGLFDVSFVACSVWAALRRALLTSKIRGAICIHYAPVAALADLNDGDNNHRLCLNVAGTPKSVFFPAGHLADPRGDLNPDTTMAIAPRRDIGPPTISP